MRNKSKIAAVAIGAAMFGGLFGLSGGVAYANTYSAVSTYVNAGLFCYQGQASTITGTGGSMQTWSKGAACGSAYARDIGGSAYLKKTSGASCATASATYLNGTYHLRTAIYNSTACGTGSFAGGGTSYGYVDTGYRSKSIMAPYEAF